MKILKFQARNMREALAQIKDEVGPDAMVVATRQVRRGLLGNGVEVSVALEAEDSAPTPKLERSSIGAAASLGEHDVERIMAPLRSELRSIRSLLRGHHGDRHIGEELRKEVAKMRDAFESFKDQPAEAMGQASTVSAGPIAKPSTGRVVALVGPTGVGKTTTVAKLAATAALVEKKRVAIVTLDTYRIGGEEQIRTFADLIGVPLVLVADPAELMEQIDDLYTYDKIFIDTAGRSPRDTPALRELRGALEEIDDLEVHLTMALSTPTEMIDATYARFSRIGIDRLLFTKLDEAVSFQELIHTPGRLKLPISYVTNGQAIPEDIEAVSAERLGELAREGAAMILEAA